MRQNNNDDFSPPLPDQWQLEYNLKVRELDLKEREQNLREDEHARSKWFNPFVVAVGAATLAAVGNIGVAYYNGIMQREVEKEKSEAARILEAVKGVNPDKAAENLKYMVDLNLITSQPYAGKITEYNQKRESGKGLTIEPFHGGPIGSYMPIDVDAIKPETLMNDLRRATDAAVEAARKLSNPNNSLPPN